ncbi:short-chain dehydrogenase [Mycobacteroides chelonae]|jgi:NAD(P)-dependent dehydrogenase (short-subunit alcohol dehydrogenase family)|uniref:SDR family NAD(P)-dependent oxidoreductase n=1 Tax=Mycobacteroides chelonae TaxID=1774 RepID=UPI0008A9528B|nr:SDR family NAD(P)-dependent oxidoreductase [Mycobacteroides chelonae]OHU55722.1 short-chain dehydrogenase [Mycobacteroides chelonae]PKQ58168.1 short-chain dehydrogenase [Mycobacterium sp. MHSD3]
MSIRPLTESRRRTYEADAVVTGAGSGIGRAFAVELARRGGRVVCADINVATARETVSLINNIGGEALDLACNVADAQQVVDMADAAEEWFGNRASLVINNAGIGAGGDRVGETPLHDWQYTIDVNLWGVIHGCDTFVPRMRAAGHGGVINVASAASFCAAPRMGAYNVSKAGVLALSETLAAELSGTAVAITVLCPALVKTNIVDNSAVSDFAASFATTLMKWIGSTPHAVAYKALEAHDRAKLHVVPQLDAKVVWTTKRMMPGLYTRALGALERYIARSSAQAQ